MSNPLDIDRLLPASSITVFELPAEVLLVICELNGGGATRSGAAGGAQALSGFGGRTLASSTTSPAGSGAHCDCEAESGCAGRTLATGNARPLTARSNAANEVVAT